MVAPSVWAIIPAHNEASRIKSVLLCTKKFVSNIVVVDDGSQDNTAQVSGKYALVLKHAINLGKGAALKTGCDFAVAHGASVIVVLDADAQHKPEDIPRFLKELKGADIVFGCRGLNKKMPLILRFGNWFITSLTSLLYHVDIPDTQTGFRAFTSSAYKKIRWDASDYSMESEMIARVGKQKLRYKKINIETLYPDRYKGTTVLDGIKIVLNLIWWKLAKG